MSIGKKLFFSVTIFFMAIGISELFLRLVKSPEKIKYDGIFDYDPEKKYRLKSDHIGAFSGHPVYTNSAGYRDTKIPVKKPKNEIRILALGDSITFGDGVRIEDTFSEQLQSQLNAVHSDRHFEVLNLGTPGYSQIQEYIDLKRNLKYKPDIAIIQFVPNDVIDPYIYLKRFGGPGKVFWHGVQDLTRFQYFFTQHSSIYLCLRDLAQKIQLQNQAGSNKQVKASRKDIYTVKNLFANPDMLEVREAWWTCKKWLQKMVNLAHDHKVKVILLATPYRFQLSLQPSMAYPQHILNDFARYNNLLYIDLLKELQMEMVIKSEVHENVLDTLTDAVVRRVVEEKPEFINAFWKSYFWDYDHPNAIGHRHVSDILLPDVMRILEEEQ